MLLHHFDHLASLTFYVYYMLCRIVFLRYFVFCLSFISHSSCTPHASLSLFLSSFIFLILLGPFVYSCQKGESIVESIPGSILLLCTFLGREILEGGCIYQGGEDIFLYEKTLFCFVLHYVCALMIACLDDQLLCYVIIVVISLWLSCVWSSCALSYFHLISTWS